MTILIMIIPIIVIIIIIIMLIVVTVILAIAILKRIEQKHQKDSARATCVSGPLATANGSPTQAGAPRCAR